MDPARLRQALLQFPGVTEGCVDLWIAQVTGCSDYFDAIQTRFPDLQAANGNEVLSYVMNNAPTDTCCAAINNYNNAKCVCEDGTLRLARQFPPRYWGLLEAGRCTSMTSIITTPDMC